MYARLHLHRVPSLLWLLRAGGTPLDATQTSSHPFFSCTSSQGTDQGSELRSREIEVMLCSTTSGPARTARQIRGLSLAYRLRRPPRRSQATLERLGEVQ